MINISFTQLKYVPDICIKNIFLISFARLLGGIRPPLRQRSRLALTLSERNDRSQAIPLEISSRSQSVSANLA